MCPLLSVWGTHSQQSYCAVLHMSTVVKGTHSQQSCCAVLCCAPCVHCCQRHPRPAVLLCCAPYVHCCQFNNQSKQSQLLCPTVLLNMSTVVRLTPKGNSLCCAVPLHVHCCQSDTQSKQTAVPCSYICSLLSVGYPKQTAVPCSMCSLSSVGHPKQTAVPCSICSLLSVGHPKQTAVPCSYICILMSVRHPKQTAVPCSYMCPLFVSGQLRRRVKSCLDGMHGQITWLARVPITAASTAVQMAALGPARTLASRLKIWRIWKRSLQGRTKRSLRVEWRWSTESMRRMRSGLRWG